MVILIIEVAGALLKFTSRRQNHARFDYRRTFSGQFSCRKLPGTGDASKAPPNECRFNGCTRLIDGHGSFVATSCMRACRQQPIIVALIFGSLCSLAPAQTADDLTQLSLENLMNVEVTSVSRKEQRLADTAAAIFVITQDDIRHSQANNIPDLLRMVPGVQVAQINANTWAISIRGFNQQFSNKLLVLVDGRSVYLPTFSGVLWDVLDLPLENIERIEVIRGPGASTWGANAVNGVINIITKKASRTQGGLIAAGGGNLGQAFGTLQYGGHLGTRTAYRVFGRYLTHGDMVSSIGGPGADGQHLARGGFRLDTQVRPNDEIAIQGDLYGGHSGYVYSSIESIAAPFFHTYHTRMPLAGGYVQTDWVHHSSSQSSTALQMSFNRYRRDDELHERRSTLDLNFENRFQLSARQDIVWGAGYRYSTAQTEGDLVVSLTPSDLSTNLYSFFIQDELTVLPNRLAVTMGIKLEHNYFTGFGWMPNARAAWKLTPEHMIWASVSRALRTPANVDAGMKVNSGGFLLPDGTPVLLRLTGNPDFLDESLLAYEAGYRAQLSRALSLDISLYHNAYDNLKNVEPGQLFLEMTPPPAHMVMPLIFMNSIDGAARGVEVSARWRVNDRWTLQPSYAFEQTNMRLDLDATGSDTVQFYEGSTPRHWGRVESHLDFGRGFTWDLGSCFTDRLKAERVPSVVRLDTQFTWQARENLSFSIVGQNLLKDRHLEFIDPQGAAVPSLIRRSGYVKLTWTF